MNHLVECFLSNRGYTKDYLEDVNSSYHKLPSQIPEFCKKLDECKKNNEKIVLATDFDMDGLMTGVIGYAGLKELGFDVNMYAPDTGSYGIDADDIEDIKNGCPDVKCIITGDVGITAYEACMKAHELGIKIFITDHHMPNNAVLPDCDVVVDPLCDIGEEYFPYICGANVMYQCLLYYAIHFYPNSGYMQNQIERLKVFAGIGTVTDEMPLLYENRELVRSAVGVCRAVYCYGDDSPILTIPGCEAYRKAFHGLFTMLVKFHDTGKLTDPRGLYEDFFGFYVGPAFNSVKRMHEDVEIPYEVFFGTDKESSEAMDKLISLTEERKRLVEEEFRKMMYETDQKWAPFMYETDAPNGIKGLLAQRVTGVTGMPAIVLTKYADGTYGGSGRSPSWFPFITEMVDLDYVHPAGHEGAFGVIVDGAISCDDLFNYLSIRVPKAIPVDVSEVIQPDIYISQINSDADCNIDMDLFEDYLYEIDGYHPFGVGFEEPVIELEFKTNNATWSYVDKEHKHIRAVLPGGLSFIAFNQGCYFPNGINTHLMPDVISVYGNLSMNYYGGNRTIQFVGMLDSSLDQSNIQVLEVS